MNRQPDTAVLEACAQHGIAVEAHSPLGHHNAELDDKTIQQIAAARNRSVAQVILRWPMQHDHIAIPKPPDPDGWPRTSTSSSSNSTPTR